jgi:hypothetical protein
MSLTGKFKSQIKCEGASFSEINEQSYVTSFIWSSLIIFLKIEEYFVCAKKDSFELFSSFMIQTNVGREIG